MIAVLTVLLAVSLAAVVALALNRSSGFDRALKEKVLVHTGEQETFEGVLVGNFKDSIELATPALLDGDRRERLKGTIVLPRETVWFVQRVG
jgi:hypothetical protein